MTEQEQLLKDLLSKTQEQTEAIRQMTNALHSLILALAEDDDPDAEPLTYMDGTPR